MPTLGTCLFQGAGFVSAPFCIEGDKKSQIVLAVPLLCPLHPTAP